MAAVALEPVDGVLERRSLELTGAGCGLAAARDETAALEHLQCFEMAGWLMSWGAASALTVVTPDIRRDKILRRVGSARARRFAQVDQT